MLFDMCQTACKTFQIRGGNSVQKFPPPCVILRRFSWRYLECITLILSSKFADAIQLVIKAVLEKVARLESFGRWQVERFGC